MMKKDTGLGVSPAIFRMFTGTLVFSRPGNKIGLFGQAAFAGTTNSPFIIINTVPIHKGARGVFSNALAKLLLTKTLPMTNTTPSRT